MNPDEGLVAFEPWSERVGDNMQIGSGVAQAGRILAAVLLSNVLPSLASLTWARGEPASAAFPQRVVPVQDGVAAHDGESTGAPVAFTLDLAGSYRVVNARCAESVSFERCPSASRFYLVEDEAHHSGWVLEQEVVGWPTRHVLVLSKGAKVTAFSTQGEVQAWLGGDPGAPGEEITGAAGESVVLPVIDIRRFSSKGGVPRTFLRVLAPEPGSLGPAAISPSAPATEDWSAAVMAGGPPPSSYPADGATGRMLNVALVLDGKRAIGECSGHLDELARTVERGPVSATRWMIAARDVDPHGIAGASVTTSGGRPAFLPLAEAKEQVLSGEMDWAGSANTLADLLLAIAPTPPSPSDADELWMLVSEDGGALSSAGGMLFGMELPPRVGVSGGLSRILPPIAASRLSFVSVVGDDALRHEIDEGLRRFDVYSRVDVDYDAPGAPARALQQWQEEFAAAIRSAGSGGSGGGPRDRAGGGGPPPAMPGAVGRGSGGRGGAWRAVWVEPSRAAYDGIAFSPDDREEAVAILHQARLDAERAGDRCGDEANATREALSRFMTWGQPSLPDLLSTESMSHWRAHLRDGHSLALFSSSELTGLEGEGCTELVSRLRTAEDFVAMLKPVQASGQVLVLPFDSVP